jgi:UDP-N-acetylglucosamine 1-carboxyvinyltransferase
MHHYLKIERSPSLAGTTHVLGAKNATLVIMASLLLTHGKSRLRNVPLSGDVMQMIILLEQLGARITVDEYAHIVDVDTTTVNRWQVSPHLMKKMRASILVMGPLLARFGRADIALPGGCMIGARPVDYHMDNFVRMGVDMQQEHEYVRASAATLKSARLVLEYPSVGATENSMMLAVLIKGTTTIINAALEPEVLDLIGILRAMGASIEIVSPATLIITGVEYMHEVDYTIMSDRLEAGALLLAAAISGGDIYIPQAQSQVMDVFLLKLEQMGHVITSGPDGKGVRLQATKQPRAVSFKTGPYPSFPTDLQAPMMAAQCIADGESIVQETVFENRMLHVRELEKMGASITVEHERAKIKGVDQLYGAQVIASDIRASCALVLAGLVAQGTTLVTGVHHWQRGYQELEKRLALLGARIQLIAHAHELPDLHDAGRVPEVLL